MEDKRLKAVVINEEANSYGKKCWMWKIIGKFKYQSYELAQLRNNFWHAVYVKHNVIWQYKK